MSDWPAFLEEAARRAEPYVLVTVVATRGSAPRDAGTRMAVFDQDALGTIGGGHLELRAFEIARELLRERGSGGCRLERFSLGASLGQCCGGVVQLLFERLDEASREWTDAIEARLDANEPVVRITEMVAVDGATDARAHTLLVSAGEHLGKLSDAAAGERAIAQARSMLSGKAAPALHAEPPFVFELLRPEPLHIALFGAGHVGRAMIGVLGALPCRVTWIDPREEEFPSDVPSNVRVEIADQPELELDALPAGSHVLIMTHSHALDQAICERALRRDDLPWCGLIGSLGKRRSFERRLRARGVPADAVDTLICPIGIDGITGKQPGEIAVAVCAQILRFRERARASGSVRRREPRVSTTSSNDVFDERTYSANGQGRRR